MDTIDQSVLSCLPADGRATYAEIGDVVRPVGTGGEAQRERAVAAHRPAPPV